VATRRPALQTLVGPARPNAGRSRDARGSLSSTATTSPARLQDLEAATREDPEKRARVSWAAIHMVQADYEKHGRCLDPGKARIRALAVGCVSLPRRHHGQGRGRPSRSLPALARMRTLRRSEGLGCYGLAEMALRQGRREAGQSIFVRRTSSQHYQFSARGLRHFLLDRASRRSHPAPRRLGNRTLCSSPPSPASRPGRRRRAREQSRRLRSRSTPQRAPAQIPSAGGGAPNSIPR